MMSSVLLLPLLASCVFGAPTSSKREDVEMATILSDFFAMFPSFRDETRPYNLEISGISTDYEMLEIPIEVDTPEQKKNWFDVMRQMCTLTENYEIYSNEQKIEEIHKLMKVLEELKAKIAEVQQKESALKGPMQIIADRGWMPIGMIGFFIEDEEDETPLVVEYPPTTTTQESKVITPSSMTSNQEKSVVEEPHSSTTTTVKPTVKPIEKPVVTDEPEVEKLDEEDMGFFAKLMSYFGFGSSSEVDDKDRYEIVKLA